MNPRENHNHPRPLVGVFINKRFLRNRNVILFARKLNQANHKARCSVYFFTPDNINWEKQTIEGYVLDGSRQWREHRLPFPDIIYDRGTGFSGRENAAVEAIRVRFKNMPGIQFINSCKLRKWQVYLRLSKHRAVNHYLPVTALNRGIEDVRAMITKYGYLFLKSSGGSGGRDVFALEKHNRGFYLHYHRKGAHRKRHFLHLSGLRTELKSIGLGPDQKIIQQGIRLVKHKNRLLDLRVLMVKDKDGIWNAVYNQARVAQKGAVITNLSLGGEVMNYSDIYPALKAKYPGIPADKQIRGVCLVIARYIEKEFGPFGEIGLDIGVDETCKVWLLEANSKPSKLPEDRIEDTGGISPQFLMTLEYARLLYSKRHSAG